MKIILNDEERNLAVSSYTVAAFLNEIGYVTTSGIALAVNDEIVPKSSWELFTLKENDRILIIAATQGG